MISATRATACARSTSSGSRAVIAGLIRDVGVNRLRGQVQHALKRPIRRNVDDVGIGRQVLDCGSRHAIVTALCYAGFPQAGDPVVVGIRGRDPVLNDHVNGVSQVNGQDR